MKKPESDSKSPAASHPPAPSQPHAPQPHAPQSHAPAAKDGSQDGVHADGRKVADGPVKSYALLEPDIKSLYMNFYKATYGKSHLDMKTKEFIAIAAALTSGCKNCLEGHLKKAKKHGATAAEISECIAITLGVNAATIVDRSDIANANLGGLFEANLD